MENILAAQRWGVRVGKVSMTLKGSTREILVVLYLDFGGLHKSTHVPNGTELYTHIVPVSASE